MGSFVLSCESTADYPRSFFEARGIEYIMFHYELDGVVHEDDLYQSVTPEAFFGALKAGSTSKTSQVSVGEYTEFWKPMLEAGKDVLHLTLSSGISGTYNSAVIAARDLEAQYPDRTVRGRFACRIGGLRFAHGLPCRHARCRGNARRGGYVGRGA